MVLVIVGACIAALIHYGAIKPKGAKDAAERLSGGYVSEWNLTIFYIISKIFNLFCFFFLFEKIKINRGGQPIALDDFLYSRYYARHNNATWISDSTLLYRDRHVSQCSRRKCKCETVVKYENDPLILDSLHSTLLFVGKRYYF